jgi:hypothetical protein
MQTFLPYDDFDESARVLDYRRLGKQRVETMQIMKALRGETKGWVNHPATKMWRGYEGALCEYGATMCHFWIALGYNDTTLPYFLHAGLEHTDITKPPWFGNEEFHISHRSNLLRKAPEHYRQFWPDVPDDIPYVWPV